MTAGECRFPVRVYHEDTDAGGVVYHTGYIRYFERARTEWLRALGYSQQRLVQEEGVLFHQAAQGAGGELLAEGQVRVACVDAQSFRPRRLPGWVATGIA